MRGGMEVEANIHRHCVSTPRKSVPWNATETTLQSSLALSMFDGKVGTYNPSMMPNAVHICHLQIISFLQASSEVKDLHHRQRASNSFRRRLRRIDRRGRRLRTNGKTKRKPRNKEIVPAIRCSHPDSRNERDET